MKREKGEVNKPIDESHNQEYHIKAYPLDYMSAQTVDFNLVKELFGKVRYET